MSKVSAVAWREFKHTALTKAFIFGAIVFPLVMWALFPLIMLVTNEETPPLVGKVVIVDSSEAVIPFAKEEFTPEFAKQAQEKATEEVADATTEIANDPSELFADPESQVKEFAEVASDLSGDFKVDVTIETGDIELLEEYKAKVRDGEILALAIIDKRLVSMDVVPVVEDNEEDEEGNEDTKISNPQVDYFSSTDIKPVHSRELKRRIGNAVVRARVDLAGLDRDHIERALARPEFESKSVTNEGQEVRDTSGIKQALPFIFMGLIWMVTFTSGQYLLTTTIEEKSNKVMEVLLSAISPMQLMTGKILGQALVAVVMLIMYGGLVVAAVLFFNAKDLISSTMLISGAIYFVMAYFFIAATMAAVGSAVNDLHEAQTLMAPIMMFMVMGPMLLMFPASQNPNGMIATVCSFIPPFIPFVMATRVATDDIPMIQIVLSIVIGTISAYGGIWAAARIFRIGVLMTGKPPTPLQLIKWVAYK